MSGDSLLSPVAWERNLFTFVRQEMAASPARWHATLRTALACALCIALVDDREWYVMANFRESFLQHIAPGMEAEVYVVSYPFRRFRGRVQGIGWALYQRNGATVGVLPATEPTLNWVRLAQRFPVRIVLEERDADHPFRMGASAVVTIKGDATAAPASVRSETDSAPR